MDMLTTAMGYRRNLLLPRLPNGDAIEAPCARASCGAVKKHMLTLAQQLEAVTVERDALRAALDATGRADWTPLGGESALYALTGTEARIVEALLKAGPDAESGEFRTVRHAQLLREVWGDAWRDEGHLLRVNISRVRFKLVPFGWDVANLFGYGYRLARIDPERPNRRAFLDAAERAEIVSLRAGGLAIKVIARRMHRDTTTVQRVLRDAQAAGGEAT
jgi:DNA-binding winged helix-turn-helix (wHTH) protein